MWLFGYGVGVQLLLLVSVFDIYLRREVVGGVGEECAAGGGKARRVVLGVVEGLRAEAALGRGRYLREAAASRGRWGTARATAPTSCPQGLLALASGAYDHPLSFLDWWSRRPNSYDTVFDKASTTFYFGRPEPLAAFPARENWVEATDCFDWKAEDYGGADAATVARLERFLKEAAGDPALDALLRRDKVMLFVHLSGVERASEKCGAMSEETRRAVAAADDALRHLERVVEEFYGGDGETAYLVTSDHGTTEEGRHGGGSEDEVLTPLVAWGAGVGRPTSGPASGPPAPPEWGLGDLTRRDVHQEDVAPLLSALLGVPVPVHSQGVLPVNYLDLAASAEATALACTAFQLAALAVTSRRSLQRGWLQRLGALPALLDERTFSAYKCNITSLVERERFEDSAVLSRSLIGLSREAYVYNRSFYSNVVFFLIVLSFGGWICALVSRSLPPDGPGGDYLRRSLMGAPRPDDPDENPFYKTLFYVLVDVVWGAMTVLLEVFLVMNDVPLRFHLYFLLPLTLWWIVVGSVPLWIHFLELATLNTLKNVVAFGALYLFLVEYFTFSVKSVFLLSLGVPVVAAIPVWRGDFASSSGPVVLTWYSTSVALMGLVFRPASGNPPDTLVLNFSVVMVVVLGSLAVHLVLKEKRDYILGVFGMFGTGAALVVVDGTAAQIADSGGSGMQLRVLSWALLLLLPAAPLLGSDLLYNRLVTSCLYFLGPVVLLSVRHEPLAVAVLWANAGSWVLLESRSTDLPLRNSLRPRGPLTSDDARRAAVFVFYFLLAYLVVGNDDDLSLYDARWVRCFLAEKEGLWTSSLVLVKSYLVLAGLVSAFLVLSTASGSHPERAFSLVLVLVNMIGVRFFAEFSLEGHKDETSRRLAHHCFAQITALSLLLAYLLGRILLFGEPVGRLASSGKTTVEKKDIELNQVD